MHTESGRKEWHKYDTADWVGNKSSVLWKIEIDIKFEIDVDVDMDWKCSVSTPREERGEERGRREEQIGEKRQCSTLGRWLPSSPPSSSSTPSSCRFACSSTDDFLWWYGYVVWYEWWPCAPSLICPCLSLSLFHSDFIIIILPYFWSLGCRCIMIDWRVPFRHLHLSLIDFRPKKKRNNFCPPSRLLVPPRTRLSKVAAYHSRETACRARKRSYRTAQPNRPQPTNKIIGKNDEPVEGR